MTNELPAIFTEAANYGGAFYHWIIGQPVEVVFAFGIIAFGYALKLSNLIPNKLIPLILFAVTIGVFAFGLARRSPQADIDPRLFMGMVGSIIWAASWVFHALVLKRFIDDKLFVVNQEGDTVFISRKREETPRPGDPIE